jgi:hypothetical protein
LAAIVRPGRGIGAIVAPNSRRVQRPFGGILLAIGIDARRFSMIALDVMRRNVYML